MMHLPPHRPMNPGMHFPLPKPYIPPPPQPTRFPPPPMRQPCLDGLVAELGLAGSVIALLLAAILYCTVFEPRMRGPSGRWQANEEFFNRDRPPDREPLDNKPGKPHK